MPRRLRRRYLALKVVSERPVSGHEVINAVWKAVLQLYGEYVASQTSISLIEFDPQRNCAVVRCSHVTLEKVRACIASIRETNGKSLVIHVLGVSGTLRALRKKCASKFTDG